MNNAPPWVDELFAALDDILHAVRHNHTHLIDLNSKVVDTMSTVKEVKDLADQTLALVTENDDTDTAMEKAFQFLLDANAKLAKDLADAIAAGANPAELQAIVDQMNAINEKLNAQKLREAVLANAAPPATP